MERVGLLPAASAGALARAESEESAQERLRQAAEAHFDSIWRLLRRLGVPEESAEDAAQQVFLVAAQRLESIRPGSERPFLINTAVRVALDARRSLARQRARTGPLDPAREPHDAQAANAEELVDQKRALARLEEALEAMTPELRHAFVLFELEGLETAEIAAALGIPSGTVASRLRRAREEFRQIARRMEASGLRRRGKP